MKPLFTVLGAFFWMFLAAVAATNPTHALGLKVAPLEYRTELKQGEKKKGFVDISNPTGQRVVVKSSVEAFRQVDDKGSLQFSKSEQLSAGILLDLDEFELGPREAVRMYFVIDGTKLPAGDLYGAIFFTIDPAQKTNGVGQSVRLGTILSIVNGTPGERKAEVTALEVGWLQLGDTINGKYRVKNTGDPSKSTGFYPQVELRVRPLGDRTVQTSSLVFAGRERPNAFTLRAPLIGFYQVSATYGDSVRSKWVFVVQPIVLLVIAVLLLLGSVFLAVWRKLQVRKPTVPS